MSLADSSKATLSIIYQVMHDITLALQFMAKKGYVHRDVSAGNIIIYNGGAKLADLEFAKEYGAGKSAYVRTGTYSFMASEVAKGEYWFPTTLKPFAHNPMHDLESLWWVGVWCALWHHPAPNDGPHYQTSKQLLTDVEQQEVYGQLLFPSYYNPTDDTSSRELHHKPADHFTGRAHTRHSAATCALFVRLNIFRRIISAAYHTISKESCIEASYFTDA